MEKFKIRCSAIGNIMAEARGNITANQLKRLAELESKESLTEKQIAELSGLIYKRSNPELSEGVKTYCKLWLKERLYNRKKYFSSKYTQKGLIVEDNSLDFIAESLDVGILIKNEEYFESEYIHGTPDAIIPDMVIDAKSSWDCFTFPLFETEIPNMNYWWQAQGYMFLTKIKQYKLSYVLADTPDHLIDKEAYWYAKNNGYDEQDPSIYADFYKRMKYSDITKSLRVKTFHIDYDSDAIERVQNRVIECRQYIDELLKMVK